jgi:hypothetical protein
MSSSLRNEGAAYTTLNISNAVRLRYTINRYIGQAVLYAYIVRVFEFLDASFSL